MRPFLIPALSLGLLVSAAALAQEASEVVLPDAAPVPQEQPDTGVEEAQDDVPASQSPQPRPDDADLQPQADDEESRPDALPEGEAAPLPSPRPQSAPPAIADETDVKDKDDETDAPAPRPTAAAMPQEERACRVRLAQMGVAFEEHPPQSEPEGCEIEHPLTVSSLGGGVALEPAAVMNCAVAEANARFIRDQAQSQATHHLSSRIAAVNQVSGYVCRPRNGTRKLSEHAFGNALDWGAVILEDDRRLDVRAYRRGSPEATFFAGLRKAACGPFTTVLGPGTDADHADHFHFDLAERSNGSTYCR